MALALTVVAPATIAHANPLDAMRSSSALAATEQVDQANVRLSATSKVDDNTTESWEAVKKSDTANVGRIWTDKSVFNESVVLPGGSKPEVQIGDSEFLVGLSALSSTSNVTSTTASPLDIVLVLDDSNSMMNRGDEIFASDLDKESIYVTRGGNEVEWSERRQSWGYSNGWRWVSVTPKTSPSDRDGTQLYKCGMSDLRLAVKNFIDLTLAANGEMGVEADKHRISLVSFETDATTLAGLTVVDAAGSEMLKDELDTLKGSGGTSPDQGFKKAQQVLQSARSEAKQVVLFFTDGQPTGGSGSDFKPGVANGAIETSLKLKMGASGDGSDGAIVYCVGTFEGANPNDTLGRANAYMNGVSSNYPNAKSYTDLGKRVPAEENYYFAVSKDLDLGTIFEQIFDEVSSGTGLPTEIGSGDPMKTGYVTFTDQLDDYMQVDEFKNIVFADTVFGNPKKAETSNADGSKTVTYTFSGTAPQDGGLLYPNGDLNNIEITVKKSADVRTGDHVTVKVPAGLIPLRNFKVYSNNASGEVSTVTNTYPIRIFFGVSPKAEVAELLGNPDPDMVEYVKANRSEDGKTVSFYTNDWAKGDPGKTIANFEPADTNSYYYFTQDTPIFTDAECTQRAHGRLIDGQTYWYEHSYYKIENGKTEKKDAHRSFQGGNATVVSGSVAYDPADNNAAYFVKGAPRITYIHELDMPKTNNVTGTGTSVLNPTWNSNASAGTATEINARLGNNGRYELELPGSLAIDKTVAVDESFGKDAVDKLNKREFTFTISLKDAKGQPFDGTLKADLVGADGAAIQEGLDVAFANGEATYKLTHGQHLYIYGISEGSTYEVTEAAADGFDTQKKGDTGSITAGVISHASFTNTYAPASIELTNGEFFASKTLEGRELTNKDGFELSLNAVKGTPMPEGFVAAGNDDQSKVVKVTTDNKDRVEFGAITYTTPGTYTYYIRENVPAGEDRLPSVSYSNAVYRVSVTVADANLDGKLDAPAVVMHKIADVEGKPIEPAEEVASLNASFVNTYSVENTETAPRGTKVLTGKDITKTEPFSFNVVPSKGAPIPADVKPADDGSYVVKNNTMGDIAFGRATVTQKHIGTHTYTVTEVIPGDAVNPNGDTYAQAGETADGPWRLNGITYDESTWTATLTVSTQENAEGKDELKTAWSYQKFGAADAAKAILFKNVYTADPVALDGKAMIKGTKVLEGREFAEGETFGFALEGADAKTVTAMEDGTITNLNREATATKVSPEFNFGKAVFHKAGTYSFDISEYTWNGELISENTKGMTFDLSTWFVQVKVADNGTGKLTATTTYLKNWSAQDAMVFTNVYDAKGTLEDMTNGSLQVSKTLTGRNMKGGEFAFAIKGKDDASAKKLAALDASEASFKNQARQDGMAWTTNKLAGMKFNLSDAGKTFTFVVDEVEGDLDTKGVTYDQSVYEVAYKIVDNGDGTLGAQTTVTRVKNASGSKVNENVALVDGKAAIAFNNTYEASDLTVDLDTEVDGAIDKRLKGRDWFESDSFTFRVDSTKGKQPEGWKTVQDITLQGKAEYKDGQRVDVPFGATIVFTEPGVYTYTVTEVKGAIAGIAYDSHTATIKITVTDNGNGKLVAKTVVSEGLFTNVYTPAASDPVDTSGMFSKTVKGRDWAEGDEFGFTLAPADPSSPMPEGAGGEPASRAVVSDPSAKDGQKVGFGFGPITVTADDMGGEKSRTFTYTVTEDPYAIPGMSPEDPGQVATLTVKVVDDGSGKLEVVEAKVDNGGFVNVYTSGTVHVDTAGGVRVVKTLTGRAIGAGDFEFALTAKDKASEAKLGAKSKTVATKGAALGQGDDSNKAVESVLLETGLSFGTADAGETFSYEVSERDGGKPGYTYDKKSHGLEFAVSDDAGGTLTVEARLDGEVVATWSDSVATFAASTVTVPFSNSYGDGASASASIKAEKALTGRPLKAGEFTFKVACGGKVLATAENAADGSVSFPAIELDLARLNADAAAGLCERAADAETGAVTFTYGLTVSEDASALPEGVESLTGELAAKLTVTDDGEGSLTARVELPEPDGLVFENAYGKDASASVALGGKKALAVESGDNAPDITGKYTFTLEAKTPGAPMPGVTETANGEGGAFSFGEIAFDMSVFDGVEPDGSGRRARTFEYAVTESGSVAGVTNDANKVRDVKVVVTDNGDGTMSAAIDEASEPLEFTNTYSVDPETSSPTGEGNLALAKELAGRDLKAGEFSFSLRDAEGDEVAKGENDASGNVKLGSVKFDAPGSYEYTLVEVKGSVPGVDYDETAYKVTATVTDDSDGTLSVAWSVEGLAAGDPVVFRNSYTPAPTEGMDTAGMFSKTVRGRDWAEGDAFGFTLAPADPSSPMPEGAGGEPASRAVVSDPSAKDGQQVKFGFGKIFISDADMEGAVKGEDGSLTKTFTYNVTEDPYQIPGMSPENPGQVATLTITVVDDGSGQLKVTSAPVANGNFVNVYESGSIDVDDGTVAGGVKIVKTLTGRAIGAGDFEFALTAKDKAAEGKLGSKSKGYATKGAALGEGESANRAVETIAAETGLSFNLKDAGKTFSYEVTEKAGNKPGYTYDDARHALDFVVSDNGKGELTVTVNLDGKQAAVWSDSVETRAASDVVAIPFGNSYASDAQATAQVKGSKALTGRPLVADEFQFVLEGADGTSLTSRNAADGSIAFKPMAYTIEKLNADAAAGTATRGEAADGKTTFTYAYSVSEDTSALPEGVAPVTQGKLGVTVVVTDDGAGSLSTAVQYPADGLAFVNAYGTDAVAKVAPAGVKKLAVESGDNAPDITGKYTFTLEAKTPGAPMPQKATATNDESGTFAFGEISFDMSIFGAQNAEEKHAEREMRFEYSVTESGAVAGVTNDADATREFTIVVTDNGDGTISAAIDEAASDELSFTNTYSVEPETSSPTGEGNLTLTKELTGRDLREGEFQFALRDADGNDVAAGVNDASGNVELDSVTFADAGTYEYTLVEVEGTAGGVTYDKTVYDVTATVTDNSDGTLSVAWSVDGLAAGEPIVFANTYQAASTSIGLKAGKMLEGRKLKAGEFEFELYEGDEKIDSAKNDEFGGVSFDTIVYTEAGEHEYSIREVKGDAEGVTYDETVYTVKVSVTDDGNGQLEWTYEYGEMGEPMFHNTYKAPAKPDPKPEDPKPVLPSTGDAGLMQALCAGMAGTAAVATGLFTAKRKRR
ncbi:MAG: FctA domain-containing protein [Coriobacteriaceae bacterium]|nr:FctA domain-containing protein [Coriobacteriaceae bacterium]